MEHQQSTWINISSFPVFISAAFHLAVNRERRETDRGARARLPKRLTG